MLPGFFVCQSELMVVLDCCFDAGLYCRVVRSDSTQDMSIRCCLPSCPDQLKVALSIQDEGNMAGKFVATVHVAPKCEETIMRAYESLLSSFKSRLEPVS